MEVEFSCNECGGSLDVSQQFIGHKNEVLEFIVTPCSCEEDRLRPEIESELREELEEEIREKIINDATLITED